MDILRHNTMNRKERIAKLRKIAQANPPAGTTAQSDATTTANNTSTTNPTLPNSPLASTVLPTLTVGWGSNQVPYIDKVVSIFDRTTIAQTNGKYNFKSLWDTRFPSGVDDQYVTPVKDMIKLFRKVWISFLNSGNAYQKALTGVEMVSKINSILDATEFKLMLQQSSSFFPASDMRQLLQSMTGNANATA